jgi:hypothetical protein
VKEVPFFLVLPNGRVETIGLPIFVVVRDFNVSVGIPDGGGKSWPTY